MVASRIALSASQPEVLAQSAELVALGNALDVVVGAVFLASAVSPTVLLGPVQLLAGGPGMGLLAVDGRLRQPGRGAPRPRGFVAGEPIPLGAHVAVPMLPAALAAAMSLTKSAGLLRVTGPARAHARASARTRGAWIDKIARRGPGALAEGAIAEELIAAAGKMAGGTLTVDDLAATLPDVTACAIDVDDHARRVARVPWSDGVEPSESTEIVAAVDGRGRLAIAVYEAPAAEDAVRVSDEIYAPRAASPVLRGETRVRPGVARSAPAPIVLLEQAGVLEAAAGGVALAKLVERFGRGLPLERGKARQRALVGVLRTRTGGQAI